MKTRKLKIEFYDGDGVKHTVAMDGPVTKEKVAKLLDVVELMAGGPGLAPAALAVSPRKYDRLMGLVVTQLKYQPFTASDAKTAFEEAYGDRISLSTVSTYLTRLTDRGLVERTASHPNVRFTVKLAVASPVQPLPQTGVLPQQYLPPSEHQ